jgi:hypothetical protein
MMTITKDMGLTVLAILIAMLTQVIVNTSANLDVSLGAQLVNMALGGLAMLLVIFISMLVKKVLPSSLPLFAYVTIVGIVICLPETPLRAFIIDYTAKIDFLSCCVGLLAFAGLSVGGRVIELKEHSWKVVLIFLIVSTCCFFGASLVAQIGFTMKGII